MFVADDPHFNRMFKMILIFTECLKWSSFSQFVFYLVLFCNVVKSLTEHCTCGTVCIRVCYVYPNTNCVTCTIVQCFVNDLDDVTEKDQIKHELQK